MKKLMLLLTFTVVGLMLTVNASAKTIVTDGLVSYWTFDRTTITDRTVEDVWGENDATIVGNPKIVGGYLKQGLELDGSGDYVSLPNVSNFGSRIGPYTFEAWFKTNQKRWSAIYKVNECGGNNNMGQGILINTVIKLGHTVYETKKDILFTHHTEKIGPSGCAGTAGGGEQPVSDGEWHHIVWTSCTFVPEELAQERNLPEVNCEKSVLYLDMEPISSSDGFMLRKDTRPYTLPIFLGAVNDNGKKVLGYFQGVFDEVRIYDRALTEEEVKHNFESGIGLSVEPIQKLSTVWGALKAKR